MRLKNALDILQIDGQKKRTDNNALVDYRTYEENENKTIKKENER